MDALDAVEAEELRRERRRRRRQRLTACCKSAVAFLFSHIGLAAMVVAYSIMGGFLFQAMWFKLTVTVTVTVTEKNAY